MRVILTLLLLAGRAFAEGERAGEFDYYVLSLSWSASWCATEGDARQSPQCVAGKSLGWVLHGLWPQYEHGWPSYCRTVAADPNRAETAAMADIMGTSGAAWYQWKKHGRCSGLPANAYFATARQAFAKIVRPEVFRKLGRPVRLPAKVVEQAFLRANPFLTDDMLTVTCKAGRIQEVRICLTRSLEPRPCSPDVSHDCQAQDALFEPMR